MKAVVHAIIGAALGLALGQAQLWAGFSFGLFEPAHWRFLVAHVGDTSTGFWGALALAAALPFAGAWLAHRLSGPRAPADVSGLPSTAPAPGSARMAFKAKVAPVAVGASMPGPDQPGMPPTLLPDEDLPSMADASSSPAPAIEGPGQPEAHDQPDVHSRPTWLDDVSEDNASPIAPPDSQRIVASEALRVAWMTRIRDEMAARGLVWIPQPRVVWNAERIGTSLAFHDGFDRDAMASADLVVGHADALWLVFLAPWAEAGVVGGAPRQAETLPQDMRLEGLQDWTLPDGSRHPCPLTLAARALRRFRGNWHIDCQLHNWRPQPRLGAAVLLPHLPEAGAGLLALDDDGQPVHRAFARVSTFASAEDFVKHIDPGPAGPDDQRRILTYRTIFETYASAA